MRKELAREQGWSVKKFGAQEMLFEQSAWPPRGFFEVYQDGEEAMSVMKG